MRITTRLILSFLLVSLIPVALVGWAGVKAMEQASTLAIDRSTAALKEAGEASIYQKGEDVARQVEIYLQAHPEATMADLQASDDFKGISVQKVGQTGYTCLYEAGTGITRIHPNPAIVDLDMSTLADDLPSFWALFKSSLSGQPVGDYYDWRDADGSIRQKYMVMVPVRTPFHGITLMIAATTYIDEFYQPITAARVEIEAISRQTEQGMRLALGVVALLALALALWMARGISRPLRRLIGAAEGLERNDYDGQILAGEVKRRDDLGHLARVFDRMAQQIIAREEQLRGQVRALEIQIDEARRARQVAEITETDYFRTLREKARELRQRKNRMN